MSRKKKIALFLVIVCIASLSGIGWWAYRVKRAVFVPISSQGESVLFEVPKGVTLRRACLLLEKEGLVRDGTLLLWYIQYKKIKAIVKAGEYKLYKNKNAWELFNDIVNSKEQVMHRLTIPEGRNIREISELVEKELLISKKSFIELCYDKGFIYSLGIKGASSVEGYLFPDTYFFAKDVDVRTVARKMVKRFFFQVNRLEYKERAGELGYSLHEIVTLASLVEKETADKSERALISAVYHGRLKRRMRLQCDPTVIYGIKDFNGNLTKKNLHTPSLYNTYMNSGLPPGPIASPGIESLKAALYPAKKKLLYFVSKNNGSHYFSYSLREHNRKKTLWC